MKQSFFVKYLICAVFVGVAFFSAGAEEFKFKFNKGDKYKILSTVKEDLFINGQYDHYSEIVNRISVEVTEASEDFGTHSATFMTSENSFVAGEQSTFVWGTENKSEFNIDSSGKYEMLGDYFMPSVLNVPVFEQKNVEIGDSWTAEGFEVYDLRESLKIEKPLQVPFIANYLYDGVLLRNEKTLHVIKVEYSLIYDFPLEKGALGTYPAHSMGHVEQTIYWDNEAGAIDSYEDEFRIILQLKNGQRLEYRGVSSAEYTERPKIANQQTIQKLQDELDNLQIDDINVIQEENGITLSIENIHFLPESAYLLDSEKQKLEKIALLLASFPDNDLLISGHTALSGTLESCQALSEKRAIAVADFLKKLGVKDEYHIFTQGFGASLPIADNSTPEGMAKNRRVEITILE